MNPLRAITVSAPNFDFALAVWREHLDYELRERAPVPAALARAWGAPACAGRNSALLAPQSGAAVFVRLIEAPETPGYQPLRSFGWAALELCVANVDALHARLCDSPLEVIGAPADPAFSREIRPMQALGPCREPLFLTETHGDAADYDLPRAACQVDRAFIAVLGSADLPRALRFYRDVLGFRSTAPQPIVYSSLNKSFALATGTQHLICTLCNGRDVFLELDQYPPAATQRPRTAGELPPGAAVVSIAVPSLAIPGLRPIADPAAHAGALYGGRRSLCCPGPDGELLELIETGAD